MKNQVFHATFMFKPPEWLNTKMQPDTAEEALQRASEAASAYYAVGIQTGVHSMTEWCGVMAEYVKMLKVAAETGHDPREIDKHHAGAAEIPEFMIQYFCEKLGCQLIPFIRGNVNMWKTQFASWLEEAK